MKLYYITTKDEIILSKHKSYQKAFEICDKYRKKHDCICIFRSDVFQKSKKINTQISNLLVTRIFNYDIYTASTG